VTVATLDEAFRAGWRITARCARERREAMKSARECHESWQLDLVTLRWTRGGAFPVDLLPSRLKCPRCGSRQVRLLFDIPTVPRCASN
jgi:hypothetical protein